MKAWASSTFLLLVFGWDERGWGIWLRLTPTHYPTQHHNIRFGPSPSHNTRFSDHTLRITLPSNSPTSFFDCTVFLYSESLHHVLSPNPLAPCPHRR
ncbi:uncharacterized protein IWZ02DRAFT_444312 [Phyllosticta citriasiana]|uniref:uncharacterized protein n=1 Tax=Phyllosticta citriasiana TaxID=595635 RepID=UPI0030FDF2BA